MRRAVWLTLGVLSFCLWVGTSPSVAGPEPEHQHDQGHGHDHGHGAEPAGAQDAPMPLQVTPAHKVLLEGVGDWSVVQKYWPAPGAEPMVSYGKSTVHKMLDGQAIMFVYETTGDMGPFKGFGTATWNAITKQYEGTWIDVFSHDGFDNMYGIYNPAHKTMTWHSSWTMPDGTRFPTRMVEKTESNDRTVSTFYMTTPDGNEIKHMEVTYTRVK